jgi:hypothetical protein
VRLGEVPRRKDNVETFAAPKPVMTRTPQAVTIEAAGSRYVFDVASGQLASADWDGTRVVHGCDLAVWRAPTDSEIRPFAARQVQQPWHTFLQNMPAKAQRFVVTEHHGSWRVSAVSEYHGDGDNRVRVEYNYEVFANGKLRVSYVVIPAVADADALPEVGLEIRLSEKANELSWLGLGPGDSLPNRRASALFGRWTLPLDGHADALRPRSGVEWLDVELANRALVRVEGLAGFRLMTSVDSGQPRLRILSHQAGAWVKGGPPERPEWRLDLTAGRRFECILEFIPSTAVARQ